MCEVESKRHFIERVNALRYNVQILELSKLTGI